MATPPKGKRNLLASVGIFRKPIVHPNPMRQAILGAFIRDGDEALRSANREAQATVDKVKAVKLAALLEVYGLSLRDELCWMKLSLKLAETYVPGFRVVQQKPRRGGRPRETRSANIFQEVNKLRHGGGLSIKKACRQLAKAGHCGSDAEELETRYHEHKRALRST